MAMQAPAPDTYAHQTVKASRLGAIASDVALGTPMRNAYGQALDLSASDDDGHAIARLLGDAPAWDLAAALATTAQAAIERALGVRS